MRVLVTGGAGFIGSQITDALLQRGDAVVVLDNFDPFYAEEIKQRNLQLARSHDGFTLVRGDIRDSELVDKLFNEHGFDGAVHCAALAVVRDSFEDPFRTCDININGTLTLLQACKRYGKPRFILLSTSAVYGASTDVPYREDAPLLECVSPYGATKIAAEHFGYIYHVTYGQPLITLRLFTAYGPRQRPDMAIHKFARIILRNGCVPVYGDGSSARDYTYIDDIVSGVRSALDSKITYGIYNLGNSVTASLSELLAIIGSACDEEVRFEHLPEQPGDPPLTCASIEKAKRDLGFDPQTPLKLGVERFVEWLLQQPDLLKGDG